MDEDQQRPAVGGGRDRVDLATAALERIERIGRKSIDAGVDLAVELLRQRRRRELGGGILGDARDDLEAAQDRLAHPAARTSARRFGLEPGPAELRRNGDLARRAARRRGLLHLGVAMAVPGERRHVHARQQAQLRKDGRHTLPLLARRRP